MPVPTNPNRSDLDQTQILQRSFDESADRLRVDADISIDSATVIVETSYTTDSMAIGDPNTDNILKINADGSIDANTIISMADDSIKVGDGTDFLAVNADGSINIQATSLPLPTGAATAANQVTGNTSLNNIDSKLPVLGAATIANSLPVNIASDQVVPISASTLPLPTGAATETKQDTQITALNSIQSSSTSIDSKLNTLGQKTMAESVPVVLASDQSAINVTATLASEPIRISGTENGQPAGTEFTFVNNLRSQILAAKDRDQAFTYADFGTKNQRITQIDYTAPSIGSGVGYTARKSLTYVLDSGSYKRTNITWSLI